jgi:TRAP-type mannitol/chloroaromatic compound transport system permease large subunit
VLLIVYGATAGVSVVKLYAGAFFPGLMLAGLYIVYVIIVAKLKPKLAPPLTAAERAVVLPTPLLALGASGERRVLPVLLGALKGRRNAAVSTGYILRQLFVALLPALVFLLVALWSYDLATRPVPVAETSGLQQMGGALPGTDREARTGLEEPPGGDAEPEEEGSLAEPPGAEQAASEPAAPPDAAGSAQAPAPSPAAAEAPADSVPASMGYWIGLGVGALALLVFYALLSFTRLEIFKMLLASFFPLLILILAVLGSIVFGLATPTEAAAVGALGGFLLALAYRQLNFTMVKESVFLTAKTSAMVCWLFVGSAIFSAAFALLGGQELVENWVLSMDLTKTQFLVLSQIIIFILGWPLEWTEIIVIFMPIFVPLLDNFGVDPLFFGLLVALNLQTAFLSPPVAMSAFYLKGVAPKHVTLNQIFSGMLPFMGIQVVAIVLLYIWPEIGLWLPSVLYK